MKRTLLVMPFAVSVLFAAEAAAPSAAEVVKTYRQLTRVTKEPKSLSAQFAGLCALTPGAVAEWKRSGPHAIQYVHYYRNAAAEQPDKGAWPVGSVLVKEKLYPGGAGRAADMTKVVAVAGMIKRAPGTTPKSGDWEFFWWDREKLTTIGMESCAGCHSGAARNFVFTDFAALAAKPR